MAGVEIVRKAVQQVPTTRHIIFTEAQAALTPCQRHSFTTPHASYRGFALVQLCNSPVMLEKLIVDLPQ